MRQKDRAVKGGLFGFIIGFLLASLLVTLLQSSAFTSPSNPGNDSFLQSLQPLPAGSYAATIEIVAVQREGQVGSINQAAVEIRPGKGRVLLALNPFTEPDTQQSADIAARVAERLTGKRLGNFDLIYSINAPTQLVGGPSAGAALTIATIAAIKRRKINANAVITGTVLPDGRIGQIGGVLEKAAAAAQAGKKVFLIPHGQGQLVYYEPKRSVEQHGFIQIEHIEYVPKKLDIAAYAQERWGLKVKEVATIQEALQYLLA